MSVLDWADLTAVQQRLLLHGPALQFDVGAEVLDSSLNLIEDITSAVDNTAGDVHWLGSARIHRDVAVNLAMASELSWGSALLRVYRTVTDPVSGLSARRDRGVFCLTAPARPLGAKVFNPASRVWDQYTYATTGQDRLYLLDRQVGYSYVQPMLDGGSPVTALDAISNVYAACGVSGYMIDGARASTPLPQDMAWPLVPASSSSPPLGAPTDPQLIAASGSAGATTWLDILNDLNTLITYQATYCDDDGLFQHVPYVDPALVPPVDAFDADATGNIIDPDRTITRDLWARPNQWIGVWQNMPDDGSGNPQTPTVANGGIYILTNESDGPASVAALGGVPAGLRPMLYQLQAATADDLAAQIQAQKAADMRTVTTISGQTTPYVAASHFDVFDYTDAGLPSDLAPTVRIRGAEWTENFDNSDTEWVWETV